MSDEETTTAELLTELVWSRARARRILRRYPPAVFGREAAVVAVVDDHDQRNPDAPAEGPGRVLSIVAHTQRIQCEITEEPQRFTAAAGINASRTGTPDPALLIHAAAVLAWLPGIITRAERDEAPTDDDATPGE